MLVAGLICSLYCIVQQRDITNSLITLLFVLLIFYCIGVIAQRIIWKQQAEFEQQQRQKKLMEEEKARLEAEEAKNAEKEENVDDSDSDEIEN